MKETQMIKRSVALAAAALALTATAATAPAAHAAGATGLTWTKATGSTYTPATQTLRGTSLGTSAEVAALINAERIKAGKKPAKIVMTNALRGQNCASQNIARFAKGDQTLKHCGYENLYYTSSNTVPEPRKVVTAWMNSKGHREAMLGDKVTEIGVGWAGIGGQGIVFAADMTIKF